MKCWVPIFVLTNALTVEGWSSAFRSQSVLTTTTTTPFSPPKTLLFASAQDNDADQDEDFADALEEKLEKIEKLGDNLKEFANIDAAQNTKRASGGPTKLGIDIGQQLKPLSEKEANELKAAAMEVINEGVAEGIDEIEKLRANMNSYIDKQRAQMELKSDLELQKQQKKLLNKIDQMTGDFLTKTKAVREETKLIARADKSSQGKGVEVGVWGVLGGAAVVTTGSQNVGLLGSVDAARATVEKEEKKRKEAEMSDLKKSASVQVEEPAAVVNTNRVIIIADTSQDPWAKQLVPEFSAKLQSSIPSLEDVAVYRPTDTIPLGGDNAICVILFLTSLSDRSAANKITERLLRRTMTPGGALGAPPTQLVGVSTLGTERTDKFPYSMQNLMGGKLDQRRQVEEAVIATVQNRISSPPLDYTICKFGEIKDSKEDFSLMPGDVLDGTTPLKTAVQVLMQAVAYQPYARNATLCAVGNLPAEAFSEIEQETFWDEAFLRLDGPEVGRWDTADLGHHDLYDRLYEYLDEWANNFARNPKGLTTPIRVEDSKLFDNRFDTGVRKRSGVQLLFLPTATGKNYLSKEEERERESVGQGTRSTMARSKLAKEGGVEIVVEITQDDNLRIRAKRCNYADGVPLKELSEETILKRLDSAIQVWIHETNNSS